MYCPCCGKKMTKGVVQSAREIFFTTEPHKFAFKANCLETILSFHNWTRPTCVAYQCKDCKKVVIDYSEAVNDCNFSHM